MLSVKGFLFVALGAFSLVYLITWWSAVRRNRRAEPLAPTPVQYGIGFVTNFFDTLGIGSFATTTSFFRLQESFEMSAFPARST